MVAFPFVIDGLPKLQERWQIILLSFIALTCLGRIVLYSEDYTKRLDWQKELLAKTADLPLKKLLIDSKDVPKDILLNTYWSSPYEFWLLSSIDNSSKGEACSIMIHDKPRDYEYIKNSSDYFITQWGSFKYDTLPASCFHFKDNNPYIYCQPKDH